MMKRLFILAVIVLGLVAVLLYSQHREEPLHVSGYIEADEIRVGSRVGGRVKQTLAVEGQAVKAGEVLLELDPYDLLQRQAEARAQLAARRAEHEKLKNGFRVEDIAQAEAKRDQLASVLAKLKTGPRKQEIAIAQANLELAQAKLDLAQRVLKRVRDSFEHAAASQDELDKASDEVKVAVATLESRRQELDQLKEGSRAEDIAAGEAQVKEATAGLALMKAGNRAEDIAQTKAAVEAAQAALDVIDRQIAELTIKAPVDGVVEAVDLQPGDLVAPNAPVLSLMDVSNLWVRTYVPENRMNLQPGQKVLVSVDSIPGRRFTARVSFISRRGEFIPDNIQTPEERSKQVFRIKATLDEGRDVLRPGMAADVWLESTP